MNLSAFTDCRLRVLTYLAIDPGRQATVAAIAAAFGVSEHHLVKVVQFLGRPGWIATVRGKGGGISLADITRNRQTLAHVLSIRPQRT